MCEFEAVKISQDEFRIQSSEFRVVERGKE
jgi:hypothetical protein